MLLKRKNLIDIDLWMKDKEYNWIYSLGIIPTVWIGLLIAPSFDGGLPSIIKDFPNRMESPFSITWCDDSLKVILILVFVYVLGIGVYLSSKRNYRKREEHGSAKWGEAKEINKKYH